MINGRFPSQAPNKDIPSNCNSKFHENREKIKKTKKLKTQILIILDFLIEKGSVVGYILRENIL